MSDRVKSRIHKFLEVMSRACTEAVKAADQEVAGSMNYAEIDVYGPVIAEHKEEIGERLLDVVVASVERYTGKALCVPSGHRSVHWDGFVTALLDTVENVVSLAHYEQIEADNICDYGVFRDMLEKQSKTMGDALRFIVQDFCVNHMTDGAECRNRTFAKQRGDIKGLSEEKR